MTMETRLYESESWMTKGIEVAQTDLKNVETKDKTFSSKQSSPKSKTEGYGSLTTDASGDALGSVTHTVGYPPAHLFFFRPGNTNNSAPVIALRPWIGDTNDDSTWGLMDNFTFTVHALSTLCQIRIKGRPNTLYEFKYFIFAEPA